MDNRLPRWQMADVWTLDDDPLVSIGGAAASGKPYEFTRVVAAFRMHDGLIAVVEQQGSQIRFYDSTGAFLRSFGRSGQGPGEFRYILFAQRLSPLSLAVWDADRVLTVVSSAAKLTSTVAMPTVVEARAILPNGMLLIDNFEPRGAGMVRKPVQLSSSLVTDSISLALISQEGENRRPIGRFPLDIRMRPGSLPLFYGPRLQLAGDSSRLFVAFSSHYEIGEYTFHGVLVRRYRRPWTPAPVTKSDITAAMVAFMRKEKGMAEDILGPFRRAMEGGLAPYAHPAFSQIALSSDGCLWVRQGADDLSEDGIGSSGASARRNWDVFSRQGAWLGEVQMPSNLFVTDIGTDYVIGRASGKLDVQSVEVRRLRKPPGSEGCS